MQWNDDDESQDSLWGARQLSFKMNNWIDTGQIEWIVNFLYLQVDIPSEPEDDDEDPDGRFAFKRKLGVEYLSVGILILDAINCLLFFPPKVFLLIVLLYCLSFHSLDLTHPIPSRG